MKPIALIQRYSLYAIFLIALMSLVGSLYFSEIMHLPPCLLCWYQRIAMYPLVAIAAVAIWFDDKKAYRYILPLSIIGGLIGIYHNLIYYGLIPESIQPCTLGISCATKYFAWLGFITIPFLSTAAFIGVTVLAWMNKIGNKQDVVSVK